MVIFVEPTNYRQSYVEKDWMVRNSQDAHIEGIDVMQEFELPKEDFEKIFLIAQESFDSVAAPKNTTPKRKKRLRWRRARPPTPAKLKTNSCELNEKTAQLYADNCRQEGAILQRESELEAAGLYYERACTIRARNGLFCTPDNASAHVEFAQNLSRRGLITKSEYHLRTALDIYRLLELRNEQVYADALLYTAVIVDRQARSFEAESFYRAAITAYERNQFRDGNFRVALDSLIQNLRGQGRVDEANNLTTDHKLTLLVFKESTGEVQIELPTMYID